mgnify:CR=1 FL=1
MSNKAKGRSPKGAEIDDPEIHDGLSVFDDITALRSRMRRTGWSGYIAEIELQDTVKVRTWGPPGHHTIWGDPTELLGSVVLITEA